MHRGRNARIRELCEVAKLVDERIDESVFRCSDHIERMGMLGLLKGLMLGSVWVSLSRSTAEDVG